MHFYSALCYLAFTVVSTRTYVIGFVAPIFNLARWLIYQRFHCLDGWPRRNPYIVSFFFSTLHFHVYLYGSFYIHRICQSIKQFVVTLLVLLNLNQVRSSITKPCEAIQTAQVQPISSCTSYPVFWPYPGLNGDLDGCCPRYLQRDRLASLLSSSSRPYESRVFKPALASVLNYHQVNAYPREACLEVSISPIKTFFVVGLIVTIIACSSGSRAVVTRVAAKIYSVPVLTWVPRRA